MDGACGFDSRRQLPVKGRMTAMKRNAVLLLHVRLDSTLKTGRSAYGYEKLELTDSWLQELPEDVVDELIYWVEMALQYDDLSPNEWPADAVLELDNFDLAPIAVAQALRRTRNQRLALEIEGLERLPNARLVVQGNDGRWEPLPRLSELAAEDGVAEL